MTPEERAELRAAHTKGETFDGAVWCNNLGCLAWEWPCLTSRLLDDLEAAEARAAAAEAQAARLAEVVAAVLRRTDAEQALVDIARDGTLGWERRHHAAAVKLSMARMAERAALAAYRQQQEAQP